MYIIRSYTRGYKMALYLQRMAPSLLHFRFKDGFGNLYAALVPSGGRGRQSIRVTTFLQCNSLHLTRYFFIAHLQGTSFWCLRSWEASEPDICKNLDGSILEEDANNLLERLYTRWNKAFNEAFCSVINKFCCALKLVWEANSSTVKASKKGDRAIHALRQFLRKDFSIFLWR